MGAVTQRIQIMKHIRLLFLLAAGLVASSLLTTRSLAAAPTNLGHPEAELINLETLKTVYLFGTPAQKQLAIQLFDPEFQGVGYGPVGPNREDYTTVQGSLSFFPVLPPDAFTLNDWRVLKVGTNTYVVSYVQSDRARPAVLPHFINRRRGPGATEVGRPFSFTRR